LLIWVSHAISEKNSIRRITSSTTSLALQQKKILIWVSHAISEKTQSKGLQVVVHTSLVLQQQFFAYLGFPCNLRKKLNQKDYC
jgi:hypothetical protein